MTRTFCDKCDKEIKKDDKFVRIDTCLHVKWGTYHDNVDPEVKFEGIFCNTDCLRLKMSERLGIISRNRFE